jgi:hypothetical protein
LTGNDELRPIAPQRGPSKGVALSNWLVSKTSGLLERKTSRRGFIIGSAMAGSAVAVAGVQPLTQQASAYTHITDCGPSLCTDGWTEFCCALTGGWNTCPPGSFAGGWWRADFSSFCNGTRYYIDCMQGCCGPLQSNGFCASCEECRCAFDDCNARRVYCNYFRYGQCHTEIAASGPIACRVVTCVPPWQRDPTCINSPAVDNRTAEHAASCWLNLEPGTVFAPPPPPVRYAGLMPTSCSVVTPASGGQLVMMSRGWDGSFVSRTLINGAWTPWLGLPAQITSGIGAIASQSTDYAVVRGSDNAIWVDRRVGQQWQGFCYLGGQSRSDPAVTADVSSDAVQVFIRGIDDALWANWFNGAWSAGWFRVGGSLSSDPVAVRNGSAVSVFVRGSDNEIWQNRFVGGAWTGFVPLGGIVTSSPAAVAVGSEIFLFVRGSDYAVWVNHFDGSTWSGFQSLGGAVISEPTAAADPSGVRVWALGWDSAIYTNQRTGSTWSGWVSLSGVGTADPVAVADASSSYVFVRGGDGGIWYGQHQGSSWTGWQWLSGFVAPARPN